MIPGTTTIRFLLVATASISAASSIARAGCKTESKTAIVMSNDINFFTCVLSFLCLCLGFPSYFFLISLITSTIMQRVSDGNNQYSNILAYLSQQISDDTFNPVNFVCRKPPCMHNYIARHFQIIHARHEPCLVRNYIRKIIPISNNDLP